jgi:hypothetical protein
MPTEEFIAKLKLDTTEAVAGVQNVIDKVKQAVDEFGKVGTAAEGGLKKMVDWKAGAQALFEQGQGVFSAVMGGDAQGIIGGITSVAAAFSGPFAGAVTAVGAAATAAVPALQQMYKTVQLVIDEGTLKPATEAWIEYGKALKAAGENSAAAQEALDKLNAAIEAQKAPQPPLPTVAREAPAGAPGPEQLAARGGAVIARMLHGVEGEAQAEVEAAIMPEAVQKRKAQLAKQLADTQRQFDQAAVQTPEAAMAIMATKNQLMNQMTAEVQQEINANAQRASTLLQSALKGDPAAIKELLEVLPADSPVRAAILLGSPDEQQIAAENEVLMERIARARGAPERIRGMLRAEKPGPRAERGGPGMFAPEHLETPKEAAEFEEAMEAGERRGEAEAAARATARPQARGMAAGPERATGVVLQNEAMINARLNQSRALFDEAMRVQLDIQQGIQQDSNPPQGH